MGGKEREREKGWEKGWKSEFHPCGSTIKVWVEWKPSSAPWMDKQHRKVVCQERRMAGPQRETKRRGSERVLWALWPHSCGSQLLFETYLHIRLWILWAPWILIMYSHLHNQLKSLQLRVLTNTSMNSKCCGNPTYRMTFSRGERDSTRLPVHSRQERFIPLSLEPQNIHLPLHSWMLPEVSYFTLCHSTESLVRLAEFCFIMENNYVQM